MRLRVALLAVLVASASLSGCKNKPEKALTIAVQDADFSGKVPGGVQVSLGLADMPR